MPKTSEITLPDEFACTMQQLVAEAEKTAACEEVAEDDSLGQFAAREQLEKLERRMSSLEEMIARGFASLATSRTEPSDFAEKLARVEEHFEALRKTDGVNQRLFNSLHEELKNYRDNFLRESLQKPFLRDLLGLFDDLSALSSQMEHGANSSPAAAQWSANLRASLQGLLEILHRMEVVEIETKERVDLAAHKVISYEPADFEEDDGRIVMRVKRGFLWRDQLLRPEEVIAKRFG